MTTKHRVVGGKVIVAPADACIYCAHFKQSRRRVPPIHCDQCDRHIGRNRTVCLMDLDGTTWCMTCRIGDGSSRWWDGHKPLVTGTQAGVRAWLAQETA